MLAILLITSTIASPTWNDVLAQRRDIMARSKTPSAQTHKAAREANIAENFIGNSIIEDSLSGVETRGLNRGSTLVSPWSGHFWPNYQGGLGARLSDPVFPKNNWGQAFQYITQNDWTHISFELLSPSEKYDLVTGMWPGEFGSLTQHQWNLGKTEFETTSTVATWQGICHGWSPASWNLPTPINPVSISTPEGDVIFTVDDIKALGALYWANGEYQSVYAGLRCDAPSRIVDGRETVAECFDVNPADWYLTLVNLVGLKQNTFMVDASAGEQVWNKPVVSYVHEYFDVASNRTATSFRQVLRERSRLRGLRFARFRSPQTRFVIGVKSTVTFADGQPYGHHTQDRKTFTYTYDLELDRNYRIIGGEWRSEAHPDFLWRPEFSALPRSAGDAISRSFTRAGAMSLRRGAEQSSFLGRPLKVVIDYLFAKSATTSAR